jgi:NAD(P)-dependent dehydrogenase (short-subunit alcohol dehydrogenase family)
MSSPFDLTARTVLVTGAATGIGRATAILLSKLGARVILVSRNVERLQQAAECLEGGGHSVQPFDLSRVEQIPQWMKQVTETSGPLWGLVHCAATVKIQPLRFLNLASIGEMSCVNLVAAFALCKGFRQRGVCGEAGSIVLLSSVAALAADPGNSVYAATKGAVIAMARTLAVELAPQKIRINCIAPAWIQTEMTEDAARRTLTPEQLAEIQARLPLGPGKTEDIAAAAAFLLADSGRWITGTTLVVDGGFTAK